MNAIDTKDLTKYYLKGKVLGLKNLNLEVFEGEIFGFLGPNGAGKTTTIRLLLDIIRPTSGSAEIFGLDIHKETVQIKSEIGYLPGEIFLPEEMTGDECISYYRNFKAKVDKRYLKGLIEKFALDTKKKIANLSKGNKQKLAIILALMHKPKLLILDEPTSGLDPLNQQIFYNAILETKKWQTTTFFSTHILYEAEKICDRIGIIKDGKMVKCETISEFKEGNIRYLLVETNENISLEIFKKLKVKKVERTTSGYKLTIKGNNADILRELLKYKVENIKIAEPSLEEIFMRYYET